MQPLQKTVWRVLKKLRIELAYDPGILLLGIYPTKTLTQEDIYTLPPPSQPPFTAKTWKQPKCPWMDEWKKKMWCIYIYAIEHLSAIKKEILLFTVTRMDPEGIMLNEKSEKDKYYKYSINFMCNLKHVENRLVVVRGGG